MNCLGYYNIGRLNTKSPNINTNQNNNVSPSPPVGEDYLYNLSLSTAQNGSIAVFSGLNNRAVEPSTNIIETDTGININNLNVNNDIKTSATTSLNNFISNVSTVINNAFSINVNDSP